MMNSFFFWLTVAAGLGALISQIVHPGLLEIVIVFSLANFAFYGYRRMTRARFLPA
jgi:hypothetical protein